MCGLFHVVQRGHPVDEARLNAATDALAHRGPDARDTLVTNRTFESPDGPVAVWSGFGHRRLAILDLDPRSNQPFTRQGRTLVYNGEIYNFRHLKGQPALKDRPFTTLGDTEVLFEALASHRLELLTDMAGQWAFSFYDEARGNTLAARDRYGKKPLFYYLDGERFCVSSTIGAILTYLGVKSVMREDMLDSYLGHGVLYVNGGGATHLKDIYQVDAGGFIEFDAARWEIKKGRYFSFESYVGETQAEPSSLPAMLREAVTSRLVSDRRVGLLLSGGIDSTLILSVICSAKLQDSVHCFIGETGRSEDALYAQQCADKLGIRANVIQLGYGGTTFERFLRICRHQEKPFPLLGNSMAMAEMYEAVAQHDVPVVLDGTGGDEVFGGYWDRYYPFAMREAFRKRDWTWLAQTARHNAGIFQRTLRDMTGAEEFGRRLLQPVVKHPSFAVRQFCAPSARAAPHGDPLVGADLSFTDAIVADLTRGRLGDWLWQNDRNAMMSSIENRSPLLDFRLAAFAGSGYRAKFVGPWNKHELRKSFDAFIPLPTQWRRQKQGFRWAANKFYAENTNAILEAVRESKVLPGRVDVKGFVDAAHRNKRYLRSRLAARLLCIAGLEQTIGLTP